MRCKGITFIWVVLAGGMLWSSSATAQEVNGVLSFKEGQRFLTLWGTHYQMGYAYGFLLAADIMDNVNDWAIGATWLGHYWSPGEYANEVYPFFQEYFTVPQKYVQEIQGLYDGLVASGIDLGIEDLGRSVTVEDLLAFNAAPDFDGFTCSSVSGWGEATAWDPLLQGDLVLARNLDFSVRGQGGCLGLSSLIVAYRPSVPDEVSWISVSFAGFIGTLSGMNQYGLGAFVDLGNHPETGQLLPNSLVPIGFSLRHGLETRDVNGDGQESILDIAAAIQPATSLISWDIHLISPYQQGQLDSPAAVLELNHLGCALRDPGHNGDYTPVIESHWVLALTNHDRLYHPPTGCWRYEALADSLNAEFRLDTQRAERIISAVAYPLYTIQSMIFRPGSLDLLVGYAGPWTGAHQEPKVQYTWEELFAPVPTWVEEQIPVGPATNRLLSNFPNPFNGATTICFRVENLHQTKLGIYNVRGQLVRTLLDALLGSGEHQVIWDGRDGRGEPVASGIYLCLLQTGPFVDMKRLALVR